MQLVAVLLIVFLGSASVAAQPALTELQRLQAEAHLLAVQNVQLRAELARVSAELARVSAESDMAKLSAQRAQLEQQFREAMKPPAGSSFNWQTLTFDAAKDAKK